MATARAINLLEKTRKYTSKKNSSRMKIGSMNFSEMDRELNSFMDKIRNGKEFDQRQLFLPGFDILRKSKKDN